MSHTITKQPAKLLSFIYSSGAFWYTNSFQTQQQQQQQQQQQPHPEFILLLMSS